MITFDIIGKRIQQRREEIKMSQKELTQFLEEKGLKMSRETVSKIENGSRATNAIEIRVICEVLRASAEDIMKEDEEQDLVSLFRSRGVISGGAMNEIDDIQVFIKDLIAQKKISSGLMCYRRITPSWRN